MTIPLSASRLYLACAVVAMLALHSCIPEPAYAATPLQLRWTAELSDPKPYNAVLFAGESADLKATLKLYGRAVAIEDSATASLYWQTNGMGSAWWQSAATVTTDGVVSATWTPAMDVGADLYRWHIGVANAASATVYRAFGAFRMQGSPGATPNVLDLPTRWIDFNAVTVSNSPWATPADVAEATEGMLTTEADPVALPVATQALAVAQERLLPSATNSLAAAAAHAATEHRVMPNGGFQAGTDALTSGEGGAVGYWARSTSGGAVGSGARSSYGGAVGYGATTSSGFAGGSNALAMAEGGFGGTPIDAIQLGTGRNYDPRTMQVYDWRLLDDDGRIPLDRMAAATNWVESIRGIYADIASNVVYHVVVSNGHWLIQEVQ